VHSDAGHMDGVCGTEDEKAVADLTANFLKFDAAGKSKCRLAFTAETQ
jgi:hypothetical protein